jgi:hypothetical protein
MLMRDTGTDVYEVWADDNAMYGPVEMSTLAQWIQEGRVLPQTWVHSRAGNRWRRASTLDSLKDHFPGPAEAATPAEPAPGAPRVTLEELRRFPAFARLEDDLLEQFASFGEFSEAAPGEVIIRNGDPGDSIYFILSGVLRVRLLIGAGQEDRTLRHMPGGEFFGELGLFLQINRTADVVVESQARLLRMTAGTFRLLIEQIPKLAAPVLFTIATSMAQRIAEDNKRFSREVTSQFLWR